MANERRLDPRQAELMKNMQMYEFLVQEARLFLDTHPTNQQVIAYYNKHLALRNEAEKEYTASYGPIRDDEMSNQKEWMWVKEPWPWEIGG